MSKFQSLLSSIRLCVSSVGAEQVSLHMQVSAWQSLPTVSLAPRVGCALLAWNIEISRIDSIYIGALNLRDCFDLEKLTA